MITLRLALAARQPRAVGRSLHRTAQSELELEEVVLEVLLEEELL